MHKFKWIVMLLLIVSLGFTALPKDTDAAYYCSFSSSHNEFYELTRVVVPHGNKSEGACHTEYYHMDKVGAGSAIVDGKSKSQFRRYLNQKEMAQVAGGIVSIGTTTKVDSSKYKVEGYDISLIQYIRVVYYNKTINGRTYKSVITMYPYK